MLDGALQVVGNTVSVLGECPVWDPCHGTLYWIDSLSNRVHLIDRDDAWRSIETPWTIGSFALSKNGMGLCAFPNEICFLDLERGTFSPFAAMPNDPDLSRLNDGKCDRHGRFWVGTLTMTEGRQEGALYRVDPDGTVTEAFAGFTNSNGLAFPPDTDFFFHSDSRVGLVNKVTPGMDGGYRRETYYRTDASRERPDGAAIDAQGYYWSALYGGGAIVRIDPGGREVFRLHIPTPYPTMIAFGGDDLKTLFVTSATLGGMGPRTDDDPMAGRLFSVRVQVAGLPEPRFGL